MSMNIAEAYRSGRAPFMGLTLIVAPGALVPREETELLGRAALDVVGALAAPRVIDMCCGCGNLACALAWHAAGAEVWAADLTSDCVGIARRNVAALGLEQRVHVRQGDLFSGLAGLGLEGTIDAVMCNPPYISTSRLAGDRAELLAHEPRAAFDGGPYGLDIHRRMLREAPAFLRPGGTLLFEIGLGQGRQVKTLFERAGSYEDIRLLADAAGETRVVLGRTRPGPSGP
jgi:release factor glutamine methyltransferase